MADSTITIDFDVEMQQLESDKEQINKILSAIGENTGDKMDDEFKKSADKVVGEAKNVKKNVDSELKKPTATITPKVDDSEAQKGTQKVITSLRKLPKEQKVKLDADAKKAGIDDFTSLLKRVPKKLRTEILTRAQKGEVLDYEALLNRLPKKLVAEARLNDNASPKLKNLQSEAKETESKFSSLKTVIAGTFIGTAVGNMVAGTFSTIKTAIGDVIQQGTEFNRLQQTMTASWTTLTGSASKGKDLVDMTNELAVSAQNSTEMVNDLNQKFYAVTNSSDKTRELSKSVLTLQDAFGQSDEAVRNFSTQWSQMVGNGKASAQDMLSIQNVFPKFRQELLQYEKEVTGNSNLTMEKLNDMMSAGKISADTMNTVLIGMGEKYKDATKNFGETIDGMERTIKARIPILVGKLVEPFQKIQNPLLGKMADWINSSGAEKAATDLGNKISNAIGGVLSYIDKHKESLKTIGSSLFEISKIVGGTVWGVFKGIITSIGDAFSVFAKNGEKSADPLKNIASGLSGISKHQKIVSAVTIALISLATAVTTARKAVALYTTAQKAMNLAMSANPYVLAAAAIVAIGVAFYQAYKHSKTFRDAVNTIAKHITTFAKSAWKTISDLFSNVTKSVKKIWKEIEPIVKSGIKAISSAIDLQMTLIKKAWSIAWDAISTTVKVVWKVMEPIVKLGMGIIKGIISGTMSVISGLWKGAWNLIKGVLQGVWEIMKPIVKTALDVIADVIKIVTNAIKGNWSGVWNGIKNLFSDIWSGIKSIGSGAINGLKDIIIGVAKGIDSAWRGIWNGVAKFFSGIWDGMKNAAKAGFNGIIDFVNGGIKGINGVVHFFGGKKQTIDLIPRLKDGGRMSKSTLALVNDEESPTYREAIFRRDGSVELPQERNVLTHLEAGDAVMPAKQTAMLLGLPQYKNGFGDWLGKAADWIGDVSGDVGEWLADKIDQLEDALKDPLGLLTGLFKRSQNTATAIWKDIADGAGKYVPEQAVDWFKNKLSEFKKKFDESGGSNPPGEGVERWRPTIKRAASMLHVDLKDWQINNLLKQIQTESGGNPKIRQQIWDINMANGTPAQGLLQFVPSTFNSYAVAGHTDIYNGLDQILAAIRRLNAMGTWNYIGKGHGWATGGHVYNKQLAWIAEDGDEFVINNRKPNADSLIASAIKQRAEINPNSFSAKIAHIIDDARMSGANGYVTTPNMSQPVVASNRELSSATIDYSGQIAEINRKLDNIANKQIKVDGSSFANGYERYGAHERSQRDNLGKRGLAVDVRF